MKNAIPLLIALHFPWCQANEHQCFDVLPGQEKIRFDSPGMIKITKMQVSSKKDYAYVATEYTGAANLQASVYLFKQRKYCLSGDLGAAVDFWTARSFMSGGLYGIGTVSKSGDIKFYRTFGFDEKTQLYKLRSCHAVENAERRKCTPNEEKSF